MQAKNRKIVFAVLGSSNGKANQSFDCGFLPDGIWIGESAAEPAYRWHPVEDFHASNENSRHYRIDKASGQIVFGDGVKGMIPSAGSLIKSTYRTDTFGFRLEPYDIIVVAGVGEAFSGTYLVEQTSHQINSVEYETSFRIRKVYEDSKDEKTTGSQAFRVNKYFYGKLLTTDDFNSEQSYFVNKESLNDKLIMDYQRESCLILLLLRMKCLGWKMEGAFRIIVGFDEKIIIERNPSPSSSIGDKIQNLFLAILERLRLRKIRSD